MNMEHLVLRFLGSNLTVPFRRANTCVCVCVHFWDNCMVAECMMATYRSSDEGDTMNLPSSLGRGTFR